MSVTQIDMIRHGEPVGGRRYRGQLDDPLSEKGWNQMRSATAQRAPWTAIISSPLARCRAFAEELAGQTGLPLSFDARLMEVAFGVWEGKTQDEILADDPDALFNFKRDPVAYRPEGAEPLDAFYRRVADVFDDILEAHAGDHVLVVAHAGVIRMAMCRVLGLMPEFGYRIQVGNAARVRFRIEENGDTRNELLLYLTAGP